MLYYEPKRKRSLNSSSPSFILNIVHDKSISCQCCRPCCKLTKTIFSTSKDGNTKILHINLFQKKKYIVRKIKNIISLFVFMFSYLCCLSPLHRTLSLSQLMFHPEGEWNQTRKRGESYFGERRVGLAFYFQGLSSDQCLCY